MIYVLNEVKIKNNRALIKQSKKEVVKVTGNSK